MTDKTASRWPWVALGVITLLFLMDIGFQLVNDPPPDPATEWGTGSVVGLLFDLMIFTFPVVGAVIAARQPRNSIGWIMLGIGAAQFITNVVGGYARYGLTTDPGSVPRPDIAMALFAGTWVLVIGPIATFLILLFPNGRLPTRRWRPVAMISGIGIAAVYLIITIIPGRFRDVGYPLLENPLGVEPLRPYLDLFLSSLLLIPLSVIASAAGLITRFRRSSGQERLQMKWLATAGAIVALLYVITMAATLMTDFIGRSQEVAPEWVLQLQEVMPLTFGLIPLAIGAAVLRHRLYDIDIIINRAIVYAVLTTVLTAIYLVGVAALQGLLRPVTGESDLAVAMATLAVAALFRPARSAIQTFIDRRFYRQRYDASVTLQDFSLHLRDEVDIGTITSSLQGVVAQTLQPNHVSLWLREPLSARPDNN